MVFTSQTNATVTQVRAAIQYNGFGANQANLSLYNDANGTPGVVLVGPVAVTNLPTFYTCCTLAVANFPHGGVPVTAGTQYWVVADTPLSGTGSDFYGVWALAPSGNGVAADVGTGWFAFLAGQPAGAVYGK